MKIEVLPLSIRNSQLEATVYNSPSTNCLYIMGEGMEESARRVVVYFEKQLELEESIGGDEGIASAKRNITLWQ